MLQGNIPQQAEQYAKKRERRKVWHRIVMTLACIVVFCTTYALILPAITMERAPSCGLEEHQHTELCYEARLICGFDEVQPAAHTHSEGCYEQQQILVCGREESAGHIHSDSCIYMEQALTCAQEHEHTPECYTASRTYVCGMAEGEGAHTHSQECYETRSILICTTPEQQPHVHTDACYETVLVCQKEEHVHSDECYPSSGEETTEPSEEDPEATEETTDPSEEATEETEEETEPEEEIEVPELEPYVIGTSFTDTVYDAAADHFDTVMHVSFRIPVSVISVGELYECNYQLPGKLSPRADVMWGVSNFHFGTANSGSAARAGAFRFTYEGNRCLCVLDFDRYAVTGDVVEGNFRFAAEISPNALQEDGTILLILSNGVGVSIPAPEMPTPETEPTETTAEAIEETTEATEETTEATEETTEATEETTEATEETTEATEETTEATEETTEPTVGNIKDAILGFIGDKLQMDGSGMGASGYEMTNGTDETEATEETTGDGGIMPLADTYLPVTKISGLNTEYDPVTEQFTSDVRIDFQFTATTEKPTAGTVYTYSYPAGIVVPDDVVAKGQQTLMDGDKTAGTYQFIKNSDSTYSVQIIFNEQYISESGDTITGYVQFEGSFGKEAINEKGNIVVGGDNGTVLVPGEDITYPDNETESSQISVSKEGTWERDGDNLVYTVYVRTIKGTPDPINLEDIITIPDGLTLGQPTVTVQRGTATYYYRNWDKTWGVNDNNDLQVVSGVTHKYNNGKLELSLPGLKGNKNDSNNATGEYYKVTYTYHIESQVDPIVTAENSVTVSAEDTTKGQTVFDSDKTTVPVDKDYSHTLDKSGQVASDKPGYIKWTVTVNRNNVNIAGATLTDQMLGLVDNTQTDIQIYPAEYAIVKKDADGKITSITFPAINDGTNTNTFTITYYTPVEESWDGTTVSNTATFDPTPGDGGDEKEVTADVIVKGVQLNKSGQFNGTTGKIDWTITVNSGGLDIAGATLTDEMFAALTDTDFSITPEGSGYIFNKDGEGKITGITFTAVEDNKNTQTYKIKYSTAVPESGGSTVTEVTNTATLTPGQDKVGTPIGSESTVKPGEVQLTKGGNHDNDHTINWTVHVNAGKLNIAGAVLTDEMFSQLTPDAITVSKDWNAVSSSDTTCGFVIHTGENGTITSIEFIATENDVNTSYYSITYSTDAPREWNAHTVHNEAKLTLNGKEIPGTADVTVPADGTIAKSAGTGVISEDGNTLTIPWTVTLNVPQGGLAAGTTIVDDVTKNHYSNTNTNQWMTRSQITAWATNLTWMDDNGNTVGGNNSYTVPPEQITFLASDGNTYTYKQISEYQATAGEGEVNYGNLIYKLFTIHFPNGLIPPEGATKLTFTYSTTVDLTKTGDGVTKFYNYVNAGGKEESAEYPYYKPYVVKTDGNGYTSETTVSNEGELTWKIKATVGQGNTKLTLTDTLPSGVTLESLQLTGWGNLSMSLSVVEDGKISGTDNTNQYTVTGSYAGSVITLEIVPKTVGNAIQAGAEFTLTVNCKVANASSQSETLTLTNRVEMRLDEQTAEDDPIDYSEQTQKWTYDRQVVDKSGVWDNTNRIMNYTVVLNPEGKDLVEGVDTLTLVDTMSYINQIWLGYPFDSSIVYSISADLIQSSVKLYEAEWNAEKEEWVAGKAVTGWSWTYRATTSPNSWESNKAINTITTTGIPDGKPLLLQYSYRVSSNVPDEQNGQKVYFDLKFSNTATLEGTGKSDDHSSSNWKWEHSSDSAGVTTDKSYTFYKVEAGNYNVSLAGAVFSVYKYDNGSYGETAVKTYTTDSSGSFRITRQEKDASGNVTFTYDSNTLYKVVETAAPTGYWMPDVVNTYYFYFSSETDNTYTLPTDLPAGAVDLSSEAKTVYVENVKNTTEISVEKVWKDAGGKSIEAPVDSITIKLYQRTTQTSSSGGGGTSGNANVTISVMKNDTYNSTVSACTQENTVQCRDGSTFTLTVNTWGTPLIYVNGDALEHSSTSSGASGSTNYIYQFVISGDTTITGYAMNDNDGSVTYSCEQVNTLVTLADQDSDDTTTETPYKTITLPDSDGNWTHTFTELPLKGLDDDNNTVSYFYYVKEEGVPSGYTVSYSNGSSGVQSGTITVTNQKLPDTTSVTVKKVWKDANGNQITSDSEDYTSLPTSIQVYLTRTAGDITERVGSDGVIGASAQPYTVTKEAGWTLTIGDLPWADDDGDAYTYSFEEAAVEGYTSEVTASGNVITITNTKPDTPTPGGTSLTVEKVWKDAEGNVFTPASDSNLSIDLNLYQVSVSNSSGTGVSYQYTSNGSTVVESGTLSDVQVDSTVQVTVTMTYDCTYWQPTITLTGMTALTDGSWTYSSNSVYTILATITESSVVVNVGDSVGNFSVSVVGQATAALLSDSDTGSDVPATEGTIYDSVTLNSSNGWKHTFTGLPLTGTAEDGTTQVSYYYYLQEVSVPAGYTVSYSNGEFAVQSGTITITNSQTTTPSGTQLKVKKEWKDANGNDLNTASGYSVTVQLAQVATTVTGGTSSDTVTSLGGENGWNNYTLTDDQLASNPRIRVTYTTDANHYNWGYGAVYKFVNNDWEKISDLKVASADAGTYYDTVELPTDCHLFGLNFWGKNDGYATLDSVDLIETVITGGTTETVVNEKFESGTLDSKGKWEYTWYNLPANDGANTTYTYYVQEVSVTNGGEANFADLFNVTVDHGDQNNAVGPSGTVIVTNTLKSTFTLPETGGGGAKPYTLGGLLLCFTAGALLLYSHSRRGKEDATSS